LSGRSQSLAEARHTVEANWKTLAGQSLLVPLQDSGTSHGPAEARQTAVLLASAGQAAEEPVQLSGRSHAPAEARHTVAADSNRQVDEQQSPLRVFPSSHCSPVSTMPLPHT